MNIRMTVDEVLFRESATRSELIAAILPSADRVTEKIKNHLLGKGSLYLAGTGYDFAHFGERIARQLKNQLGGVACLWTTRCGVGLSGEDEVFALPQEFVEPIGNHMGGSLIVCASVLSDKTEILTHLIRLCPTVQPKRIIIATALANRAVKQELEEFLTGYFGANVYFACDKETSNSLGHVRDDLASRLDTRMKIMPIISEWLLERRFGPRPAPKPEKTKFNTPSG